ncbi:HD-GYP domain-containing protein [Candidatus Clostridium radicumherbarum]|uniref:HD-GYP domain-containing protein n=1 Tax=Candidatus Clostridium radicumherbarum TaxID=3381662 RepID=A0ABW8TWR0_9CLOT
MKDIPLKLKVFLASLYIFTIATIIFMYQSNAFHIVQQNYMKVIFFSIVLAVSENFRIVYKDMALSTSLAVLVASFILFGPLVGNIIIVIGFSLTFKKVDGKYHNIFKEPFYKVLFNYCAQIIPMMYGGLVYISLGGNFDLSSIWSKIPLVIIYSIIYLVLNTLLISILFSILNNKKGLFFFINIIRLSLLNSVIMTPFGIVLAYMFNKYNYIGVLLVIFPIVLVRYTFSLYLESKNQYIQTVDTLMHAMEARDKYTEGHSKRVCEISSRIAKELKYSDTKIERIRIASLLHDVGKIGIDDKILNKPGKLTNEEYEIIKSHPGIGYNILKDIKNLQDILPIVRNHHERYDGKGYPDGKSGNDLNLDVFIVQLADSIDAMSTDRPYRKALSEEEIMAEINKFRGSQFHPKVVDAYTKILEKHKNQKAV